MRFYTAECMAAMTRALHFTRLKTPKHCTIRKKKISTHQPTEQVDGIFKQKHPRKRWYTTHIHIILYTRIQAFPRHQTGKPFASVCILYIFDSISLKKVARHWDKQTKDRIYIPIYMITGSRHLNNTSTNTNTRIMFKVQSNAQMTPLAGLVKTQHCM